MNKFRPKNFPSMNVLIQVNHFRELKENSIDTHKYQALEKVIALMPNLNLRGIMAIPSKEVNIIKNNIEYEKIKNIFNQLKRKYLSVDTLSLGTNFDIKRIATCHKQYGKDWTQYF